MGTSQRSMGRKAHVVGWEASLRRVHKPVLAGASSVGGCARATEDEVHGSHLLPASVMHSSCDKLKRQEA